MQQYAVWFILLQNHSTFFYVLLTAFFGVLLTVHLSIFILVSNQLDAQNLFYSKFISCLYMFRTPCDHRQEVITPIGVTTSWRWAHGARNM